MQGWRPNRVTEKDEAHAHWSLCSSLTPCVWQDESEVKEKKDVSERWAMERFWWEGYTLKIQMHCVQFESVQTARRGLREDDVERGKEAGVDGQTVSIKHSSLLEGKIAKVQAK